MVTSEEAPRSSDLLFLLLFLGLADGAQAGCPSAGDAWLTAPSRSPPAGGDGPGNSLRCGTECPGLPAHQAHMVSPASRTPPAALHQPALGDYFSFRLQNVLSAPGPSWLRAGGLSPGDLPTHHHSPLQEKLA